VFVWCDVFEIIVFGVPVYPSPNIGASLTCMDNEQRKINVQISKLSSIQGKNDVFYEVSQDTPLTIYHFDTLIYIIIHIH